MADMTIERKTIRELELTELDQVSGGQCQCGSDGSCVTKGADGVKYTCGGMPLYGGSVGG
jgi:hypothetical protein